MIFSQNVRDSTVVSTSVHQEPKQELEYLSGTAVGGGCVVLLSRSLAVCFLSGCKTCFSADSLSRVLSTCVSRLQDTAEEAHIKREPDDDVEIRLSPVFKKLSVRLMDCRIWLEGRDFLYLGEILK